MANIEIPITIIVPVGPKPSHKHWLNEAVQSVREQMSPTDEAILIDNGADVEAEHPFEIWRFPHPMGLVAGFNAGVALAKNNLVLMLGSDDYLLPGCLDSLRDAYREHRDDEGWYYLGVQYSDGDIQNTACHASMVTKKLWEKTGGFPLMSVAGMADHVFISLLLMHGLCNFYKVSEKPLYFYRQHPDTETITMHSQGRTAIAAQIKGWLENNWRPNDYN